MSRSIAQSVEASAAAAAVARTYLAAIAEGGLVLNPPGTNYKLSLVAQPQPAADRVGQRIQGTIRLRPRKIWTVPSGGAFIEPIVGPPRIVQGRIRHLDPGSMVVQAAVPFLVELPEDDRIYDLANGPLAVGAMVNVAVQPPATWASSA